jgi:hypothetical protein
MINFALGIAAPKGGAPLSAAFFTRDVASALLEGVAASLGVDRGEVFVVGVRASAARRALAPAAAAAARGLAAGGIDISVEVNLAGAAGSAVLAAPAGAGGLTLAAPVDAAVANGLSSGLLTRALASSPERAWHDG